MKKLLIIFAILINTPAVAFVDSDMPGACSVSRTTAIAVYEPYSYTCDVGYFLPADTLGCEPCPAGFTCDGGTFDFNPTLSQGLVQSTYSTQNLTNTCSLNFINAFAVFEPATTIDLTYDYGDGNTENAVCVYQEEFDLPPTPTRVGYIFTGWKVKTAE